MTGPKQGLLAVSAVFLSFSVSICLVAASFFVACAPRIKRGDDRMILEEGMRQPHSDKTPIEAVEIPRSRTGSISKMKLESTLDAGVGRFLSILDVAPFFQEGQFTGWEIRRFDNPWVDLLPGDIVTSINEARIETPTQVQLLWLKLRESRQIVVSVAREQENFELRFDIQGTARSEVP